MSLSQFFKVATILLISSSLIPVQVSKTLAGNQQFYCGNLGGLPATFVRTPQGNKPLILWVSEDFDHQGWSKTERCQEVSRRFQTFNNNGKLKYIRTGIIKGNPVICVASRRGGTCGANEVLLTFKPGTDVNLKLKELINTRRGSRGVFVVASGTISNDRNGVIYADVEQWINEIQPEEPAN